MLATSQFHQLISTKSKGASIRGMVHKMLFCFSNISAEILLYHIGYSLCNNCFILAYFCQMLLQLKTSKKSLQKLPCFVTKMSVTPVPCTVKIFRQ
jgi:hypothetical protein